MTGPRLIELGRATTHGQVLPLGVDDPVIAARAVRRALAVAGRRAVDVDAIVIATGQPVPDVLTGFARRALGSHGETVRTTSLMSDEVDAAALVARATAHAGAGSPDIGIVIALGLAADGTTEARCLEWAIGAPAPPEG